MPEGIRVEVDRAERDRLMAMFSQMKHKVADWKPFWPAAQSVMHRSILANFRQAGRPNRWEPLSGWTMRVRAARGAIAGHALGQNILMDQGTLFQSIGNVHHATSTDFRYGTNLIYARMMHFGTAGLPGGVLRPKKAKYLTLPYPGVKGRPSDYKNTFVLTTRKSKAIWQKIGKGQARPLFLLKKSVKIEARPFMMFQPNDVDQIISYAWAYVLDDAKFRQLRFVGI